MGLFWKAIFRPLGGAASLNIYTGYKMVKVRAHHARDGVPTTIFFTKDDFAMKEISAPKLFLELDLQHQAA